MIAGVTIPLRGKPILQQGKQSLDDLEKRALMRTLEVLELFRAEKPQFTIGQMIAFLRVALEEGKGVSQYADEDNSSLSVMSRHLLDIGLKLRNNDPGLGLVEVRANPMSLRDRPHYLSSKGAKLARRIASIVFRQR